MLIGRLHHAGLRSWHLQLTSFGSIGLCIGLWIRAKTVDQTERGNAERRALFVGLWPPMIWLIGETLERETEEGRGLCQIAPSGRRPRTPRAKRCARRRR